MTLRRLLYTLLVYFIFPIVLLRMLVRGRTNTAYRGRWSERFGFVDRTEKPIIWLHAVSVGEAIAAKPLIKGLLDSYPNHQILVTTTTPTGSDRVKEMFKQQILEKQLLHTYFPYDLPGSVSRFVKAIDPKALIVVETEIWPNLYAKCYQKKIPIVLVNARLSEGSTQAYLKIKGLVSEALSKVNVIAVRSQADAERFTLLGADVDQIRESGNIKYDINIDQSQLERSRKYKELFNSSANRLVYVAASTHEGEDEKILTSYISLLETFPNLMLILVPRHPERFDEVYNKACETLPDSGSVFRQSQGISKFDHENHSVIIGDTMGEMQMWYASADVVFIGGSLVKVGGHNPLESTLYGVPVVSGPYMYNFDDVATALVDEKLLYICKNESEIAKRVHELLKAKEKGEFGDDYVVKTKEFMQQHQGVTARLLCSISSILEESKVV